jgi:XrtN system VIT domain protein
MTPEALSALKTRNRFTSIIVTSPIWKDPIYITGLIMLGVSLIIYHVGGIFPAKTTSAPGGFFMLNFVFPVTYFIILLAKGRLRKGRNGLHPFFLFLTLFLVSAYALNREVPVFEKNVTWFSVILVVACINYIAFVFFEKLPNGLKVFMSIVAGVAMLAFAYLAIYLFPIYALSLMAFFALGISIHAFVPLLFCIYTIVLIRKIKTSGKIYQKAFIAGMLMSVAVVTGYVVNWGMEEHKINSSYLENKLRPQQQLPSWVTVAQDIPDSYITEKILKTELMYSVPEINGFNFFWQVPNLNFETVYHDPLVMISTFFCGRVAVPTAERAKILTSIYNARHQAQERLWSGENLITEQINTRVKLWPELRIGYTELTLVTGHVAGRDAWSGNEEAIYTFQLPEGGVVTSLSLWIDDREEKGILTTKAKAASAYKTIVGVESRDPSVVHWQEGNMVSVRVFPVTRGKSRKFKIGVTAPLAYDGKNVRYNSMHFQGPGADEAKQTISVDLGRDLDADVPHYFTKQGSVVTRSGQFNADWSIAVRAPELSTSTFTFNNYAYGVSPLPKSSEYFSPGKVYLDINASWTLAECNRMYSMMGGKKVFVESEGSFVIVNSENKSGLFEKQLKKNFSLFPFYLIQNDESSLVISKGTEQSPAVDELRGSSFFTATSETLQSNRSIHLFNLGTTLSPYLKSLREFRAFQYDEGDENKLKDMIVKKQFVLASESDDAISIHSAGIQVTRKNTTLSGTAPDDLMRLYAYNHILQRAGTSVLNDNLEDSTLMTEASEAHIVSPFSSLVVLETQKDYDRFDITSSKNSLENASMKSKGAVPEPHEWALIIVVLLLLAILKFRPHLILIGNK